MLYRITFAPARKPYRIGLLFTHTRTHPRSPPFWLLIGQKNTKVFWHQSEARTAATVWNWSGKTFSQGIFSPFFTFLLRAIFFRPFRLSLAPTICPWVSEEDKNSDFELQGGELHICRIGTLSCWYGKLSSLVSDEKS